METKIYNLVILDQSGSMWSIMKEAISGFNETLQTIKSAQKKYEDQKHMVSLMVFNGDEKRLVYDCVPVAYVGELDETTYRPDSSTPLFDAIGNSITHLRKKVQDEDKVLVTIITDGMENASVEYSGKNVKDIINELKEKGWVFAYIGANHNVEEMSETISIDNQMSFESNPIGTNNMFEKERTSRMHLYAKISRHEEDLQCNYFEENDEESKK